jgi:hypothetical protein
LAGIDAVFVGSVAVSPSRSITKDFNQGLGTAPNTNHQAPENIQTPISKSATLDVFSGGQTGFLTSDERSLNGVDIADFWAVL